MLKEIFVTIITVLSSFHASLYTPDLPKLPIVDKNETANPITLTISRLSASTPPELSAKAYLILDQHSGEILAEKNPDTRLFPASTTKIMTALVVLRDMNLNETASVSAKALKDGSHMGLFAGEQIKVKDLLAGLLIQSANDAAFVLADIYPGGEEAFIFRMNTLARELKLNNTYFTNPIGYSEPGHITTVRDLLILSRTAMQEPEFAKLVNIQTQMVYSTDGVFSHRLETTNELLGKIDGIQGIKTGWTEESGECLVAQATRDGQTLLTAVLDSEDRFDETKRLFAWGFESTQNQTKTLAEW